MAETVSVVVARGRSIISNDRVYGPGETVELSADDEAHIRAGGFIHDPHAYIPERIAPIPQAENNPSNIGLQRIIER